MSHNRTGNRIHTAYGYTPADTNRYRSDHTVCGAHCADAIVRYDDRAYAEPADRDTITYAAGEPCAVCGRAMGGRIVRIVAAVRRERLRRARAAELARLERLEWAADDIA